MLGALYVCGSNSNGQLGALFSKEIKTANQLFSLREDGAVKVACGEKHTLVLMKEGSVLSCGSNEHMQLGRETKETFCCHLNQVKNLDGLVMKDVSCWNMSACIDQEKNLYVWGTLIGKNESFQIE
jgi:alpha-tubulin suppressor-like RCC1 family protein